ncbi:hypothetical protein BU24DRAFT_404313 [Aaosphaeria arxii CBS 175.79]|uniref:Uncharacterized protein n=1 Tax=Aaosphaeria arxii CBS 175.79 TaxID=1450172 RepID=A0A6A5Y7L2_9PLEO|nr:uncharacterized protein BU24DRAFT_404313 [Aaosphaeria arxii CBS 175.79]KAF2021286.1 hypothetical protein BU24DRAFT_404313 [Aaosphaeria arxii CBS 175.79]
MVNKPAFNFITLSHPDDLKDKDTQKNIRRLAMAEVGRSRRKPKTARAKNEIALQWRKEDHPLPPGDFDRLGSGTIDPFTQFPIELDDTARALVMFIFQQNSTHSSLLRGSWWPVGLYDAATFNSVLSNSQVFLGMQQTGQSYATEDSVESLAYYSNAVQIVMRKLDDPKTHTSKELLGAVGSFVCHNHIIGAFDHWAQHRQALLTILDLSGGVESIKNEDLRITMSWCELGGAFALDIPTMIPMPSKWLADSKSPPGSPRPLSAISLLWKRQFPMKQDWITIFDDISQLISRDRALTDKQIEAATASGAWTEPTVIRLLAIRPLHLGICPASIIEEICRLGTLLFIAPIWRAMGASPVWTFTFTRKLLYLLNSYVIDWQDVKPLLIWSVYFAAIETNDGTERAQFCSMLAVLITRLRIPTWETLMEVVKNVLWMDKIFIDSDHNIRKEVMSHVEKIHTNESDPTSVGF